MGSPFLILAHSFKKESLGRTTTLVNSFLPQNSLDQTLYKICVVHFTLQKVIR